MNKYDRLEEITKLVNQKGTVRTNEIVEDLNVSDMTVRRDLKELESKVGKDKTILLLCRSGNRSAQAAEAAFNAGFEHIYNVLEGFEGDLNDQQQRNQKNGWRIHQLPWQQD